MESQICSRGEETRGSMKCVNSIPMRGARTSPRPHVGRRPVAVVAKELLEAGVRPSPEVVGEAWYICIACSAGLRESVTDDRQPAGEPHQCVGGRAGDETDSVPDAEQYE